MGIEWNENTDLKIDEAIAYDFENISQTTSSQGNFESSLLSLNDYFLALQM